MNTITKSLDWIGRYEFNDFNLTRAALSQMAGFAMDPALFVHVVRERNTARPDVQRAIPQVLQAALVGGGMAAGAAPIARAYQICGKAETAVGIGCRREAAELAATIVAAALAAEEV